MKSDIGSGAIERFDLSKPGADDRYAVLRDVIPEALSGSSRFRVE